MLGQYYYTMSVKSLLVLLVIVPIAYYRAYILTHVDPGVYFTKHPNLIH